MWIGTVIKEIRKMTSSAYALGRSLFYEDQEIFRLQGSGHKILRSLILCYSDSIKDFNLFLSLAVREKLKVTNDYKELARLTGIDFFLDKLRILEKKSY